ncbi:hypothetical protein MNV49_000727 [Pseudohyphozyma bogoriensis]|nr:hypothetical protein MNV49_000727 [Pseudohyphozyma bogoriensis]
MVANKLDLQKRQHRERAQPLARQKLGLLEKHADYVKRARDFHSKEDRIQKLREKAAGRNKDEFYFGMIRSKTLKGVHVQSRGNEALPMDLVKVLKTQDAGYIRTQRAMEQSRVEKLQQELDSQLDIAAAPAKAAAKDDDDDFDFDFDFDNIPAAPKRKHIVFTSDLDSVRNGDASSVLAKRPRASTSTAGDAARPGKRSRKGKAKAVDVGPDPEMLAAEEAERIESAKAHQEKIKTELDARKQRLSALTRALRELEVQRLVMGKGAKKALVPKKATRDPRDEVDDWGEDGGDKGLPEADEGIASGARVWAGLSESFHAPTGIGSPPADETAQTNLLFSFLPFTSFMKFVVQLPFDVIYLILVQLERDLTTSPWHDAAAVDEEGTGDTNAHGMYHERLIAGRALCLTCSTFLPFGRRLLYRHLELQYDCSRAQSVRRVARLVRRGTLGANVRSVTIRCRREEVERVSDKFQAQDFHVLNLVDRACPAITSLQLLASPSTRHDRYLRYPITSLSQALQYLVFPYSTLAPRLEELAVLGDRPPLPGDTINVDVGPALRACANLKRFSAKRVLFELVDFSRLARLESLDLRDTAALAPSSFSNRVIIWPRGRRGLLIRDLQYFKRSSNWIIRQGLRAPFLQLHTQLWTQDRLTYTTISELVFHTASTLHHFACQPLKTLRLALHSGEPDPPIERFSLELRQLDLPATLTALYLQGDLVAHSGTMRDLTSMIKAGELPAAEFMSFRWMEGDVAAEDFEEWSEVCYERGICVRSGLLRDCPKNLESSRVKKLREKQCGGPARVSGGV